MSDESEPRNDAFLAAAVGWVRAALSGDDVAPARARADALVADSAFAAVASAFGLTGFEQSILLLCVAFELDTQLGRLCAQAAGDGTKPYPTYALAMSVFPDAHWDAQSAERPLRTWHLVEHQPVANQPMLSWPLRADPRILNAAKGLTDIDDRFAGIADEIAFGDEPLAAAHADVLDHAARAIARAKGRVPVIQFAGADSDGKRAMASHLARALGASLHTLPAAALPTQPSDISILARLWDRECALTGRALSWTRATPRRPPTRATLASRLTRRCGDSCPPRTG